MTDRSNARLRDYLRKMTLAVEQYGSDEAKMLDEGERLLADLVGHDDWLPEAFAQPSTEGYRQYLLYCDPLERFSVVSFVWGPGQKTPVHDHTVWGLVGMMRGAELCEEYNGVTVGSPFTSSGTHRISVAGCRAVAAPAARRRSPMVWTNSPRAAPTRTTGCWCTTRRAAWCEPNGSTR